MSNGFFGGVKALVSSFSSAERMTTSLAQSSPAPQISKIRLQSYLQKRASENFGSLVFFQKLIISPFRVSVRGQQTMGGACVHVWIPAQSE